MNSHRAANMGPRFAAKNPPRGPRGMAGTRPIPRSAAPRKAGYNPRAVPALTKPSPRPETHFHLRSVVFPAAGPLDGSSATKALSKAVPGWAFSAEEVAQFREQTPSLIPKMTAAECTSTIESLTWALQLLASQGFNFEDDLARAADQAAQYELLKANLANQETEIDRHGFAIDLADEYDRLAMIDDPHLHPADDENAYFCLTPGISGSGSIASGQASPGEQASPDHSRVPTPSSARSSPSTASTTWSARSAPLSASSISSVSSDASFVCASLVGSILDPLDQTAHVQTNAVKSIIDLFDDEDGDDLYGMATDVDEVGTVEQEQAILRLVSLFTRSYWTEQELFRYAFMIDDVAALTGISATLAAEHMDRVLCAYLRWYTLTIYRDARRPAQDVLATRHTKHDVAIRWRRLAERWTDLRTWTSRRYKHIQTLNEGRIQTEAAIARLEQEIANLAVDSSSLPFTLDSLTPMKVPAVALPGSLASQGFHFAGVPTYLVPFITKIDFLGRFEGSITRTRCDELFKHASKYVKPLLPPQVLENITEVGMATGVYYSRQMDQSAMKVEEDN